MPSKLRAVATLLFLLALIKVAWAQEARDAAPAASVEEQFSAYQRDLSDVADALLAAAAQESSPDVNSANAISPSGIRTDERALQRFAQQHWKGDEQNVRRAIERVAQLRPTLESILAEEGVPNDVAALVLVESGGRLAALSPKGARGAWQFMPDTARRYGLSVNAARDERLDLAKSTRAAARYLRDLHRTFGDWQLAFAAYNAGEHAVAHAVASVGAKDFSRVRPLLPAETRNYVPAVRDAMTLLGSNAGNVSAADISGRRRSPRLVYAPGGRSNRREPPAETAALAPERIIDRDRK